MECMYDLHISFKFTSTTDNTVDMLTRGMKFEEFSSKQDF